MKKLLIPAFLAIVLLNIFGCNSASDKSKRPSQPAKVTETTDSGVTITIDYSQPSVKGRTIGRDIAPYGKVWRTGANEATVFEVNKPVTIEGMPLPAAKYGLYSIPGENEWTIIFNKTWDQWGTKYSEADDVLRVQVTPVKTESSTEQMTIQIAKNGTVSLLWGTTQVNFSVQ